MGRSRRKNPNTQDKKLRSVKLILGMLVLGGFGAGMYWAGQAQLFQAERAPEKVVEVKTVVKKPVASKPNRAFGAVVADMDAEKEDNFQYTFFEILGDSSMNRFVDLNGEIAERNVPVKVSLKSKKTVSNHSVRAKTPAPVKKLEEVKSKNPPALPIAKSPQPSPKTGKDKVVSKTTKPPLNEPVSVKKKKLPKKNSNEWVLSSLSQLDEKSESFWVQVASFKKLDRAQGLEEKLKLNGFFPFIREIEIKGMGQWYRVYLGKYPSRQIANRYADMARKKLKLSPVILKAG
ncbi:MAG: SPOR domain-containing protein [Candidatus Nitronauta litoralis]|uniref:SPOR domain-containing protein n=1 Tax=Candidatus Nitronauta litoralis TaxID=2705533 RepID=A0A7T0BYY2_9BACT|nr:MAG: SPOR domain-containing protein [Candidatus Nitronauta litoralis]